MSPPNGGRWGHQTGRWPGLLADRGKGARLRVGTASEVELIVLLSLAATRAFSPYDRVAPGCDPHTQPTRGTKHQGQP